MCQTLQSYEVALMCLFFAGFGMFRMVFDGIVVVQR